MFGQAAFVESFVEMVADCSGKVQTAVYSAVGRDFAARFRDSVQFDSVFGFVINRHVDGDAVVRLFVVEKLVGK